MFKKFKGKILFLMFLLLSFFVVGCMEEHNHDHSVEIEGKQMRFLSVYEIAHLWGVDAEVLLQNIIVEFDLKRDYTVHTMLDDIRDEYKFSPAMIKDMAEELKVIKNQAMGDFDE